jgi:H+/gluconate symporter-like permease
MRTPPMSTTQYASESGAAVATKLAPPATVTVASLAGYTASELVMWATLFYTILVICHKSWQMWRDFTGRGVPRVSE